MSVCRECGRPIVWLWTVGGKRMPCDPHRVAYWQTPGGSRKIVTISGEVESAETKPPVQECTPSGFGFVSHFATCPAADEMRKGRHKGK